MEQSKILQGFLNSPDVDAVCMTSCWTDDGITELIIELKKLGSTVVNKRSTKIPKTYYQVNCYVILYVLDSLII